MPAVATALCRRAQAATSPSASTQRGGYNIDEIPCTLKCFVGIEEDCDRAFVD
jgi:hypothetical protein